MNPKKKEKKFTEDFIKKWEETSNDRDEEVARLRKFLRKQEDILRKQPRNAKVWFSRGEILARIGEYEKALKCFDAVQRLDPKHRAVYNARANALAAMGRQEEAVEYYRKALEVARRDIGEVPPPKEEKPPEELLEELISEFGEEEAKEVLVCPYCGEEVSPDDTRCPSCGTEFLEEVDEREILEKLSALEKEIGVEKKELPEEEEFRRKIEKWRREGFNVLPLEEILETQPERARTAFFQFEENLKKVEILKGTLESMAKEGFPEDAERIRAMLRSPYKIWAIEAEMQRLWEKIESSKKEKRVVPPEKKVRIPERVKKRGLINGLKRERLHPTTGRINGLINGIERGRRGLSNGLTNGVGMTNGLGYFRFKRESKRNRWKLYLIPLVTFLLLMSSIFFIGARRVPHGKIVINGSFEDWKGVETRQLSKAEPAIINPNIDIVETAAIDDGDYLALYVRVAGTILSGNAGTSIPDTFQAFIDIDRNPTTGYLIRGIGADYMVEIYGCAGAVYASRMFEFQNSDQNNWSAWGNARNVVASAGGSELEAEFHWEIVPGGKRPVDMVFHSQSWDKDTDYSDYVVSNEAGILNVAFESTLPGIPDNVLRGSEQRILRIEAAAIGKDVLVRNITIHLTGTAKYALELESVSLTDEFGTPIDTELPGNKVLFEVNRLIQTGSERTFDVSVSVLGETGNTLGATILFPRDVEISAGAVNLEKRLYENVPSRAYLGFVPSGFVLDGAFAEWNLTESDPRNDVANPNIDVVEYSKKRLAGDVYFYLRVDGEIMYGTSVPYFNLSPVSAVSIPDSDRDSVPDSVDPFPYDFNNDGRPDSLDYPDIDGDGIDDFPVGNDKWLNTTIPSTFPEIYRNKEISIYIGIVQRPSVYGYDVLRIFIDFDNIPGSGYAYESDFFADYLLEIQGKNGKPLLWDFKQFAGGWPGQWKWLHSKDPSFQIEDDEIEVGIDVSDLSVGQNFSARFNMTDWASNSERAPGTRSTTRGNFGEYDIRYKGSYEAFFSERSNSVKCQKQEQSIVWTLPELIAGNPSSGFKSLLRPDGGSIEIGLDTVTYDGAYDSSGSIIRYTFEERRMKEEVVIDSLVRSSLVEEASYIGISVDLTISKHIVPLVHGFDAGSGVLTSRIDFYDGNKKAFSLDPPFLKDSRNLRIDCEYLLDPASGSLKTICPAENVRTATFPFVIDPTVNYTLEDGSSYNTSSERLATSLAVGDFNGDGYADVLAGAPYNGYSGALAGLALIFYGPFSSDVTNPDVVMLGQTALYQLGGAVAAGKLNNDDYWDAVVTQRGTGGPTYIFYGYSGWSGLDTSPNVTISSQGGAFGTSVAVGNINGTYYDDVVVGAPSAAGGGKVYIFCSPFPSSVTTANDTLAPNNDTAGSFGKSIAVGKVDNDDLYDIVVGEPDAQLTGAVSDGRVQFFRATNIDFHTGDEVPDATLQYTSAEEKFGFSVSTGNLNSDNYEDILVGAPENDEGGTDIGRAYVFLANSNGTGITNNSSPNLDIPGESAGSEFGYSVLIGNAMGSSTNDAIIGARYYEVSSVRRGKVYVYDDPLSNLIVDETFVGTQDLEYLGWSIAGGKFQNDNIYVLAIGSPYWDNTSKGSNGTDIGRVVVLLIPEFPLSFIPVMFVFAVPLLSRRRRTTSAP